MDDHQQSLRSEGGSPPTKRAKLDSNTSVPSTTASGEMLADGGNRAECQIDVKHVRPVEGYCQVQYRGPEAKTTEVEARVALICASTDDGRSSQAVVDWVASQVEFQRYLISFRVHELKELLRSTGCSQRGRKNDLFQRSNELLQHGSPKIQNKIREIYERSHYTKGSPFSHRTYRYSPTKPAPSPTHSYIVHPDVTYKPHPFFQKVDSIIRPTALLSTVVAFNGSLSMKLKFHLTPQQVHEVYRSKTVQGTYQTQILLRFCRQETSCPQEDYYPKQCYVRVNSHHCPIPGYHPQLSIRPDYKRNGNPVNITNYVKTSAAQANEVVIFWAHDILYPMGFCVCIDMMHDLSASKSKGIRSPDVSRALGVDEIEDATPTSPMQQPFKTESMRLFEQAMKEGYIEVSIIKCLLLGTAGVGKTCLLHLLLGMLPPQLRQSTGCIEQAIRAICVKYGIDSWGEWQKVDSDGLRDRLAGSVSCHQKEEDADIPPVPASDSSPPNDQEEEAIDFTGPKSYTMEDIVKLLEEEAQLGRLQDMTWVYLVDSGGQPQFHELLTAFFRNALIGIFVHKLSERLDDHPHVRYFDKEGKECGTGYRSPLSNRDLFQHCIQTVQSLPYTTEESICPRLGVVGTFRDDEHLCTGESRYEKNKQFCEILRPILDNVLFRTGLQEVIFPVNAVSPDDEDKEIARKLRYKIESLKPPPEKLPLKWYGLELELEKEAAQRNRWVFTKEECLQVAKRLHFPSDEALVAALVHLDKLNIFLYYPSVLPELVFCSPCVLLDKVSELVEESYRLKHGPDPNALVEGKFSGFCNKGLITAQLLEGYPKHYTEFFTQAHLLKLFESLLIVAPIDHDIYFMPSLLDVLKRSDFQRPSCGCQLVISFKGRYAPLGLFSSLVAFLLSDKTEPSPWVVFGDTSKLYRNHITFYLDSYPGSVVLIDSAAFFEVYLILDCTDLPELYKDTCRYVSHTIEMGLNEAIKARNFQNVCYHKAISCPCEQSCRTLHPALLHTCSGTQFWKCTQRQGTCGKLDERHHVWVKKYTDNSGAGEETSCHAVKRNSSVTGESSKDQGKLDCNQAQNFNVDDTPLDEHSLRIILDSISILAADWFKLGVALGLSHGTLKTIESNHSRDAHRCLTEMVIAWLQMKDNVQPSWQSLTSALSSPSVGRIEIATMIATEHPP